MHPNVSTNRGELQCSYSVFVMWWCVHVGTVLQEYMDDIYACFLDCASGKKHFLDVVSTFGGGSAQRAAQRFNNSSSISRVIAEKQTKHTNIFPMDSGCNCSRQFRSTVKLNTRCL
jgi:hypothetical protein